MLKGPAKVMDVCARQEGHVGLTEWSREWATFWLERFGRRFATYKVRGDKGQKRVLELDQCCLCMWTQRKPSMLQHLGSQAECSTSILDFEFDFTCARSDMYFHDMPVCCLFVLSAPPAAMDATSSPSRWGVLLL